MKFIPKFGPKKTEVKRRRPTFVSPYPIVNRILASDPLDAFLLEMEIEMWTDEQFRAAFDTGMSPGETTYAVWNDAWDNMGREFSRTLQAKIDKLPPETRRQLLNSIE